MMPGLPVPVALWWALVKALILFIAWVLTKLGIHICRGYVFDTPQGRAAVVVLFVHLDDTDEGVVSKSVFLTNIFFDPFGHIAITGFIEAGYASYLSGVLDDFYPFTSLLVTVGLLGVNTARTAIVDGPVVFKTHRTCMLLQNGLQWRLPACAIILVLMHLVLGDPQLRCFVLPIVRAWCYWGGVGLLAPSLSPNLFKAFLGVAKKVRPLVKQLDAAYEANNVLLAYQLKDQLAAELALYDPYLAHAYDGEAQRGLLATVRDELARHKIHCEAFWKRCSDLEEPFYLIVAGGATVFEPSKPPLPLLVLGSLVLPEEVASSRYEIKKSSNSDHVIRALGSPLTRMMGCLLRDNHSEGTLEHFFEIETPAKIVSMVRVSLFKPAVFGGRLIKCVAVPGPLDETTGQPDFSKAFWTEREGPHALGVSPPVEQLFREAIDIDERPPRVVLELRSRVEALNQEGAASIAAHVASINEHRQAVADRLEARRADGSGLLLLAVAYFSRDAMRDVSDLAEPEKTEAEKLRFRNFDAMELSLADRGVEVIVGKEGNWSCIGLGVLGNCALAVVPDGTIFDERGVRESNFPTGITALARRGLLFTESGIMRFVANPDLLNDIYAKELDEDRVYVYIDEDAREAVQSVGTAEKLVGGHGKTLVKFNSGAVVMGGDGAPRPRFRSAETVRAERAKARRAKRAEPLQELSGREKAGHSVGPNARKPRRDFQTELHDAQGLPNWRAMRALAKEWRAEVAIFDARKKKYDVEWGGHPTSAITDFNKVFKCGQTVDGDRLRGGELMRHYVKKLDEHIKKNEPDSLQ